MRPAVPDAVFVPYGGSVITASTFGKVYQNAVSPMIQRRVADDDVGSCSPRHEHAGPAAGAIHHVHELGECSFASTARCVSLPCPASLSEPAPLTNLPDGVRGTF